mgnify:CR=1 FL=1
MKENYRDLKAAQARRKEDEASMAEQARMSPRKSSSKLIQFQNVQSRVYEVTDMHSSRAPLTSRSTATNGTVFLTRGASQKRLEDKRREAQAARKQVEASKAEAEYYSTERPATPTKAAVPARSERGTFVRRNADFVQANKAQAQAMMPPSPRGDASVTSSVEKGPVKHATYGRVPKYLEQRKAEWKLEQQRLEREKADKDCPPGMTLMKEDERLSTLETLEQSKVEVAKMLSKLPFVVETVSARKKVEALEARLKEIENAIILFSKPKVYIAKDL